MVSKYLVFGFRAFEIMGFRFPHYEVNKFSELRLLGYNTSEVKSDMNWFLVHVFLNYELRIRRFKIHRFSEYGP